MTRAGVNIQQGASVDSFVVGPLTHVVSLAELAAWMDGTDAELIYAHGRVYPTGHPVVGALGRMAKAGTVAVTSRKGAGGNWEWIAQRATTETLLAQAEGVARTTASATPKVTSDGEAIGDAMLRLIRRRANMEMPCPTLKQLGEIAEIDDGSAVRRELKRMEDAGLIRVQNSPDGKRRIHLRGGKVTGWLDMRRGA